MGKKKKKVEPKKEDLDDDLDEFDEDDEDIEISVPDLKKKPTGVEETVETPEVVEGEEEEEIDEEDLEYEFIEEDDTPEHKYLYLKLENGTGPNDYMLFIPGQSHGICNILVKHLLDIEGVTLAAYKDTKLDPAQIYIRLNSDTYKIKEILGKGINSLREEVTAVNELFQVLF